MKLSNPITVKVEYNFYGKAKEQIFNDVVCFKMVMNKLYVFCGVDNMCIVGEEHFSINIGQVISFEVLDS